MLNSMAGTNASSSHTSQFCGMPLKLPHRPPVEREAPKKTSNAGKAKRLACIARSNSNVAGCNRCSDGIACSGWQQMLTHPQRAAVLKAFEHHPCVVGSGCVDHQLAQAVTALERPLRHVDMLHARLRHVD